MICPHCKRHFVDEGRSKGGKASKRKITPEQQSAMQKARRKNKLKKSFTQKRGK
jgi:hypothetical protein